MLYLVATPIGNLSDLSLRAIETLKACDYILCEDTRHSSILLQHYQIHKPLQSFHKFNEAKRESAILSDLKKGLNIALISDAGTPGIADPGADLVTLCRSEGIPVTAIPGPCAAIMALSISGLSTERFQFVGFLPKKESELKELLLEILIFPGTSICYEAPHRIAETMQMLAMLAPERRVVIARELTKTYEEVLSGKAEELLGLVQTTPPRGEIVLLIEKGTHEPWKEWSIEEHVGYLQSQYHMALSEALKLVAELRHIPKKDVYKIVHREKK